MILLRSTFRAFTSSLLNNSPWRAVECPFAHRSSLPCLRLRARSSSSSSSSSSTRWLNRQARDAYSKEAKVKGLKSRAAFKLLQMHDKYHIFKRGMTVVDLGYAPGSWSQVAIDRTKPGGRVLGVDIIPALPPKGVSTVQGNFLSRTVQESILEFLRDPQRGRVHDKPVYLANEDGVEGMIVRGYVDQVVAEAKDEHAALEGEQNAEGQRGLADVVLSDMMMNTSGVMFRDHAGSIDLCNAALGFCLETLKPGGTFVCKFYQGAEDKILETRLKRAFEKVHRDKPDSSRKESREQYFVALKRKADATRESVFGAGGEKEGQRDEWVAECYV